MKVNQLKKTGLFIRWFGSLKDPIAKATIVKRLERAEQGNFGDHKSVGDGIFEMRISAGKGYRIYYAQQGNKIYLLISGGNKATQQADIEKAKYVWKMAKCSM